VADESLQLGPVEINATGSIGAAVAPAGTDADVVIGAADAALYRAKAGGRNAVRMADASDLGRQAAD
jgi:two-component system, cell cycle response regulator